MNKILMYDVEAELAMLMALGLGAPIIGAVLGVFIGSWTIFVWCLALMGLTIAGAMIGTLGWVILQIGYIIIAVGMNICRGR